MTAVWVTVAVLVLVLLLLSMRIVRQWEGGVLLRFGRFIGVRKPGLNLIIPIVDRLVNVDTRVITTILEPQEVITKDNVTIKVDAVVYFKVVDPEKAVVSVADFESATTQIALTTLRSVLGQSELDEVLAHRDRINERLREIIDTQTEAPWGVRVSVAEVKDVLLPENMQRAMARQAEAEREKRAKVVHAEGEKLASTTLSEAAQVLAVQPVAVQLRYLQAMVEMAGERNSTIIPIPLDILGALQGLTRSHDGPKVAAPTQ